MNFFSCSSLSLLTKTLLLGFLYSINAQFGPDDTARCNVHPDPHITSFHGIYLDFQGGCDVVMLSNPRLKIHLRLRKNQQWSGFSEIERLAIRFSTSTGFATLEIDSERNHFYNDPDLLDPNPPLSQVGGYPIYIFETGTMKEYKIHLPPDLNGDHYIYVNDFAAAVEGGGLAIQVNGHGSMFEESVGICSSWFRPPGLYERDGTAMSLSWVWPFAPIVYDGEPYGEEWQVQPGSPFNDPEIISTVNLPLPGHNAYPDSCVASRRKLGMDRNLQAGPQCPHCRQLTNIAQIANCEYDASVIGCWWVEQAPMYDPDYSVFYDPGDLVQPLICPEQDNRPSDCVTLGLGKCVNFCDTKSEKFVCVPCLCGGNNNNPILILDRWLYGCSCQIFR